MAHGWGGAAWCEPYLPSEVGKTGPRKGGPERLWPPLPRPLPPVPVAATPFSKCLEESVDDYQSVSRLASAPPRGWWRSGLSDSSRGVPAVGRGCYTDQTRSELLFFVMTFIKRKRVSINCEL